MSEFIVHMYERDHNRTTCGAPPTNANNLPKGTIMKQCSDCWAAIKAELPRSK